MMQNKVWSNVHSFAKPKLILLHRNVSRATKVVLNVWVLEQSTAPNVRLLTYPIQLPLPAFHVVLTPSNIHVAHAMLTQVCIPTPLKCFLQLIVFTFLD